MKQGRKISIVSRMFAVLLAVMMVCSNISIPSKAAETVQTIAAWEYKDKDSAPSSLPAGATSGSGQLMSQEQLIPDIRQKVWRRITGKKKVLGPFPKSMQKSMKI